MVRINVEDQKDTVWKLNGIKPFNEEMTFYYDESGNCRKFYLTDNGFNDPKAIKGDFVLAGIAHSGKSYEIDLVSLHEALEYKEGQKELKFKHLYHNSADFVSFMGSKRATEFLEWLDKSGLYIHYSALNNLFYSLVDIVDSLWETHPMCIMYFGDIKNALYDFTIEHHEVIDILIRHTYPDVKDTVSFCYELCALISEYNDDSIYNPGFFLELFRQMLKAAGKMGKLPFIQDNEPNMLIKEYYLFYLERCEIFSKSIHIFDEEKAVENKLSNIQLYEHGKMLNHYKFVKSHENIFVQISDMIAGLLRRLFMFLDEKSIGETKSLAEKLNENQISNFNILWRLMSRSDEKSPLLIKNANTHKNIQERMMKLQILGRSC